MDGDQIDVESLMIGNFNFRESVNVTCDGFNTEKDAQEWFCSWAKSTGVFRVFNQVHGSRIIKHHLQSDQDRFISDVLLLPIDERIVLGAIVVEIKRSGEKIGPAFSQLKDYMQCVFPVVNNIGVIPTYGFLFPCKKQNSATASWMQHQHIGSISINQYNGSVLFYSGEERLLEFSNDGRLVYSADPKSGKKSGTR